MDVLGLDVGGANLKASHTSGAAASRAFALWRDPGRLADELRSLVASMPPYERVALTMTGELCDCFESKAQGVSHILDAAEEVFSWERLSVWTTAGQFVGTAWARERWLETASANWLALATFAGRYVPSGPALLIDVGTTTTDIIPLLDGKPVPTGRTDAARLTSGELLYRGWRRTPLCAVYPEGAAELFATMHDVCLVLKLMPEDVADRDTADGQPATREAALRRLARMDCADRSEMTDDELDELAEEIERRVAEEIERSVEKVLRRLSWPVVTYVLSGSGAFLLGTTDLRGGQTFEWLNKRLGLELSSAACAYAVAVLRAEAG